MSDIKWVGNGGVAETVKETAWGVAVPLGLAALGGLTIKDPLTGPGAIIGYKAAGGSVLGAVAGAAAGSLVNYLVAGTSVVNVVANAVRKPGSAAPPVTGALGESSIATADPGVIAARRARDAARAAYRAEDAIRDQALADQRIVIHSARSQIRAARATEQLANREVRKVRASFRRADQALGDENRRVRLERRALRRKDDANIALGESRQFLPAKPIDDPVSVQIPTAGFGRW